MSSDFNLAIRAAIEAGKAILEVYNSTSEIEITSKQDDSPLTEADLASNRIINSYLSKTDHPIISEENRQLPFEDRKAWRTCWIVDPLDGTKEFIKRNGEFTVNIALCHEGKPIFGIIYVPVTKELYCGDVNKGEAFKTVWHDDLSEWDLGAHKDRISPAEMTQDRIRVVGSRSHMNEDTERFIENLKKEYKEVEIVSKGSSLKFCLVAEGKADVYPRFAPTMEWDTAAGQAICNAVGLEVIDQNTQKAMEYNRENLLNAYFLVQ